MTEQARPKPRIRRCPICAKTLADPVANSSGRFCSERCAKVDLGRWLNGDYAIPVRPEAEDPEAD